MSSQDDDVPPLDPVKVTVFVLLLGAIAFAGWRFMRAQAAVAAVAEASKDYRKLFPARSSEAPVPPPQRVEGPTVKSGMSMLQIDDDMRTTKPVPAAAVPQPPKEEAAPVPTVEAKVQAAAPVKPARKAFNQPRLNSGGISGLNGGSGVGLSGGGLAGGGGGAPTPAPGSVDAAAAAAALNIPGMPPAEKQ